MAKIRLEIEAGASKYYTKNIYSSFPVSNVINEDTTIFEYDADSYDANGTIPLNKNGVYKISWSIECSDRSTTISSFPYYYFNDIYNRTLISNYMSQNTVYAEEYIQSFDNNYPAPSHFTLRLKPTANVTYTFEAGYIEIEYLGDIADYINTPSSYAKYLTLLHYYPDNAMAKSTVYANNGRNAATKLFVSKDLYGLFSSSEPQQYTIVQAGDYKIKFDLELLRKANTQASSVATYFEIRVNTTVVYSWVENAVTYGQSRTKSEEVEVYLNAGDRISFYNGYTAAETVSISGIIGIQQLPQAPTPDIALGGFTRVKHNPTTLAFEIEQATFKKSEGLENLEEEYTTKLYRQFLYQDILEAQIKEEEYEATLSLTVRKEAITNFLYYDPTNTYLITYYEQDTAGRERTIIFFLDKILENGSKETNSFIIEAKQKKYIVNANVSNNQNHIIGTTENDLQVNENSNTAFTYPETWNKYIKTEGHLTAIENLINRNLINARRLQNGKSELFAGWRIMPGLQGVNFEDLGDYSESEITLELSQENTIEDALEIIYDQIGHRLDWEVKRSGKGYYINFFAPKETVIDWDDSLTFVDSYTFTKDYSKAKVVSAFGTGFTDVHKTNYELVNRSIRPVDEILDVKETARNSEQMARNYAAKEVPKTREIYEASIAFKTNSVINFYDTKPRTKLIINRLGRTYYYRIAAITITIDKSGVNHIYDLEAIEEE